MPLRHFTPTTAQSYDTFQRRKSHLSAKQQQQWVRIRRLRLEEKFCRRRKIVVPRKTQSVYNILVRGRNKPKERCQDSCSTSTGAIWRASAVGSSAESSSRRTTSIWSSAKRSKVNKSISCGLGSSTGDGSVRRWDFPGENGRIADRNECCVKFSILGWSYDLITKQGT